VRIGVADRLGNSGSTTGQIQKIWAPAGAFAAAEAMEYDGVIPETVVFLVERE
jgi:hypothetical protein